MLVFPERDADMLLSLQPDDPIVVTGKIRDFFLSPMLDALTVERAYEKSRDAAPRNVKLGPTKTFDPVAPHQVASARVTPW
jgi:hypothetical protein